MVTIIASDLPACLPKFQLTSHLALLQNGFWLILDFKPKWWALTCLLNTAVYKWIVHNSVQD